MSLPRFTDGPKPVVSPAAAAGESWKGLSHMVSYPGGPSERRVDLREGRSQGLLQPASTGLEAKKGPLQGGQRERTKGAILTQMLTSIFSPHLSTEPL